MNRHVLSITATAFVLACFPATAGATSITAGARIVVSPTTIVVPVEIVDGKAVTGWHFDLTYDPTDLQVNLACDPFGGDPYCSLVTGPVTEGDFFAAGSPFNVLVPGFVDLDPSALNQTGLLFGVAGTFGGSAPPYPSGDGTLAFVEFTVLGTGASPLTVVNPSVDAIATPEPTTLLLLLGGLPFVRSRRSSRSRYLVVGAIVAGSLLLSPRFARAQTTTVGPYYATPSWDQTVGCTTTANCPRFVVLSNFNNEAVLDRETGLVWERTPNTSASFVWRSAAEGCIPKPIGGRVGWRVPTVSEMGSLFQGALVPDGISTTLQTSLPAGHPFSVPPGTPFWTATPSTLAAGSAWLFNMAFGPFEGTGNSFFSVWCVRSGVGPAGS